MTEPSKQARWYVYTLSDPIDGRVFYVGKGSGNRIYQHEREAARSSTVCSKKVNKIRDLLNKGIEVQKAFHAHFWDEQAAYDHETDLIDEIGLENLTNVLPGGQKAWERRKIERASRKAKPVQPLHVWLEQYKASVLFDRFAEWFRFGGHDGVKVKAKATDSQYKLHATLTEAAYNSMLPMMWKKIASDPLAFAVFKQKMLPFGVELNDGRA